jgi:MFS family permease
VVVNQTWAALLGFASLGLGLSSIAPLMLASAARADLKNAGRNIGIVNAVGYSANLVSPATITFVVTQFGLQRLLLFPIGLLLPLAILGPVLMRWSEQRARHENAAGGSARFPQPGRNTKTVGVT